MIRHIRTFPLSDSEIKQLERDLTGMALEAEKRGEDFEDVLDMTPTEFCDELLYSIGGSKAPGGRYLLKGAGIYYQLTGILGTALFSLILLLALFYTIIIPSELAQTGLLVLFVAAIGLTFFCYLYHLEISLNAIVAQPKSLHSLLIMERFCW